MPDALPIYEIEQEIISRLAKNRRLIIQAPTGSGKSTQVPQILLNHRFLQAGQVIILQPRRLAARLLAARVASERRTELGREVGYQIRFENVAGPETKIKYVTEGILLRQMLNDRKLQGVQALVFDEFHERHLYGDITLARALDLQESSRPDLLILVMSATLDAGRLKDYLGTTAGATVAEFPCEVLSSEGRTFPVNIEYGERRASSGSPPVWESAADVFADFSRSNVGGDVLIFMPGSFEISQTLDAIRQRPESKGYILLPLHGELLPRDQDAAVARYQQPKVVVSTNVAETSLTIDGVKLVIDSGLARIPRYDPNRGINTLLIEKISRASADQRAGRAGRTSPGQCIRLWTSQEHFERPAHELPEIKRLDLAEVVLTLKAAGVEDLRNFRWLEAPSEQALQHAEELLLDLGALKKAGPDGHLATITELGRRMLAFPVHPRYARMLLAAREFNCVYQACLVAALTQGRDLLIRNPGKDAESFREDLFGDRASSDFWILMRAWNYAAKNNYRLDACRKAGIHAVTARQVGPLLEQFLDIAKREGLNVQPASVPDEALEKCILIGFSDRVARRLDEGTLRCELVHGRRGMLARESVVHRYQGASRGSDAHESEKKNQGSAANDPALLVAAEVREVEGREQSVNTLLSLATSIKAQWLRELFPEDIEASSRVYYDGTAKRVCAEEELRFRSMTLFSRRTESPSADAAARILAEEVMQGRLVLKNWDHTVDQWILRLGLLTRWCPELQLSPIHDEDRRHLIEQICHGAVSYKDIKDREVKATVKSWLSEAQQELVDKHTPERLSLGNGRTPKITYTSDGQPYVSVRIQELYDVQATPRIVMNRVPLLVHILAPNMRAVQITQDLSSFWKEHYPKLKQELQRKYPKHEWR